MAVFVKKLGRHVKKFSPSPLWGYRLPVTALALLARRPDANNGITFGLAIIIKPESHQSNLLSRSVQQLVSQLLTTLHPVWYQ